MFEEIMDLPAHPLLVHAAVVFVPLLALGSVLYAIFPPVRARINWAVALVALAAAGSAVLARLSGDAFRARLQRANAEPALTSINAHKQFGDYTMWAVLALAIVTLLLVWATPVRRRRDPDYDEDYDYSERRSGGAGAAFLQVVLAIVVAGLAAASVYYVFRTGDSGARMVWEGR
jgi:hypothetical protein